MKSLFSDNRLAVLLQQFRNTQSLSVNSLASRLEVSDRTIRNDIKQLNEMLNGCALIDGQKGYYSLRVFDPEQFQHAVDEISETDDFLNSPRNRMDFMFGRLMRADAPLLTDDLAYEMSIGRTTLVGDLKKLRSEVEAYHLTIQGKTNQGLTLCGSETDIRRYVLETNYEVLYETFPLDQEIEEIISRMFTENRLERKAQENFRRFVILMLDRFLTGHFIGQLTDKTYNLSARSEFSLVSDVVDQISRSLQIELPVEEKLFVLMPIIGMRTPADIEGMRSIELDESVRPLTKKIRERIREEMNLTIRPGDFRESFLYHLMFMINRMRFGIRLPNPLTQEVAEKYPLAWQMAGIAADVIAQEYDLPITRDEQAYLATYFGVFLAESQMERERFRIAAVYTTGRVTARLIEMQLSRILTAKDQLTLIPLEEASPERLAAFDLVLSTQELEGDCGRPVIRINEIFNEQELRRKIDKARYWDEVDSPALDSNWFVMAGLLDREQFFVMETEKTYEEALHRMVDSLCMRGLVDEDFEERLAEREKKGTMVFDNAIALPHAIQYAGDRIVLAIGVFPKPIRSGEHEISIIFLLALPEHVEEEDNLLIRLYDEIIVISQDKELRDSIAKASTYQQMRQALYRQME
ncbi:MAG: PRD domain-containing protein [Eubacterium sp.]|nr:PRD domain-containing protein [Eubacterium sp.]